MLKRDLYYERIPTKSLRDDVRYLGNILGRVIKKQEGEIFFEGLYHETIKQIRPHKFYYKVSHFLIFLQIYYYHRNS